MKRSLILALSLLMLIALLPVPTQSQEPTIQIADDCPTNGVIFIGNKVVDLHVPADLCTGGQVYWKRDSVEIPGSRGQLFFRDSGLTKGGVYDYQRCCTSGIPSCTDPTPRVLGRVYGYLCRDLDWSGGTYDGSGLAVHVVDGATLSISGATVRDIKLMTWSGPTSAPVLGGDLRIQDSTLEDVKLQFGSSGISYFKDSILTGSSGVLNSYETGFPNAFVTPARIEVIREGDVTISGNNIISTTIHIDGEDNQSVPGPGATITQNEFHDVDLWVDAVHSTTTDIVGNQFFYAGRRVSNDGLKAVKQDGSKTVIANNSFERTGGTFAGANAISLVRDANDQIPITQIENNTFRGYNQSTSTGGDTAVVFRRGEATLTGNIFTDNWHGMWVADDAQVTAEGNSFVGNETAIWLHFYQSLSEDVQLTLRNNCIAGNTLGIENMVVGVDAKSNWWGDPSGPYHASRHQAGGGDEITGSEGVFDAWLTTDNCRAKVPATLVLDLPADPLPADGMTQVELRAALADQQGPVPGATIRFRIPPGMGHVWPTSAVTDAQGRATVQYQVPRAEVFEETTQAFIQAGDKIAVTAHSGSASDSGDLAFQLDAPQVKQIDASGIGTLNDKPEAGSPVTLIATYTEPTSYKVEGCLWGGDATDPVYVSGPAGGLCTYVYVPHSYPWSHGRNRAVLALAYEHTGSGEVGLTLYEQHFPLFFNRDEDYDLVHTPNWFEYWARDGAMSGLGADVKKGRVAFDPTMGADGLARYQPATGVIKLGPGAVTAIPGFHIAKGPSCPGLDLQPVEGLHAAARVLAQEEGRKGCYDRWEVNGAWYEWLDSDDETPHVKFDHLRPADNLPDKFEEGLDSPSDGLGTSSKMVDSCNLAQFEASQSLHGDLEFFTMWWARAVRGIAKNDWANPGEQAGGLSTSTSHVVLAAAAPTSRSGPSAGLWPASTDSPAASATDFAQLSGTYADAGQDDDSDGLYDRLKLSAGVDVSKQETYNIVAWLEGGGTPIAWASTQASLAPGSRTVQLFFDGQLIRDSGIAGPYNISLVELRLGSHELVIDAPENVHTTAAYGLAEFDPPDAAFNGAFADLGIDSGSDGLYDLLRFDIGLDVVKGGSYTVTGELTGTTAIGLGQATADLTAGAHTISLDLNGASIFSSRQDGPYQLQSLRLENAAGDRLDFLMDADTTGAYAHTAFQHGTTTFDASKYSDQGIDSNGNGRYDSLRFGLDINVGQAGTYRLLAHLVDGDGAAIHSLARQLELGTGTQTVHLDFSGLSISGHGMDGPYQVRSLSLLDSDGALVDSHPFAHTTQAYAWTEFEYQGFTHLPVVLRNVK